ncbi:PLP-dependent aminotransferase family protein [Burkholderia singularis]|uniref:MocR-like pyridoxine biosynthesis transcription factor PdxR n=1 Tax=Burkholderia singularis TaxID=1503053 RepID=UPI0009EA1802|nr:PLP-dependent aminotransferase family protein [Burkholderia singularis]
MNDPRQAVRAPEAFEFSVDRLDSRISLSQQIYDRLRDAIAGRALRPGARLPSTRSLASALGVARGTVEAAYQRLAGEGYVLAQGAAGTVVSPHLTPTRVTPSVTPSRVRDDERTRPALPDGWRAEPPLPLQLGIPALDVFPRKLWSRLAGRRVRAQAVADLAYGDPVGYRPLRDAIAGYLLVSRGVRCRAEQVVITAGYRASLSLIERALLRTGDQVWVEDPCHLPTRAVLTRCAMRVCPIPVDGEGLVVEEGVRRAPHAAMAVVTPSHQAPLGVSMSLPRRLKLLEWASAARAWIVEDDYDGEFRYSGFPLPALKHLDTHDRVLYAGSFSKVLAPGLSLGYLVVPKRLIPAFADALDASAAGVPWLTQAVVADFIDAGHLARHLKKMRALYARRRAWLCEALTEVFAQRVQIDLAHGGMHLVVRLAGRTGDRTLAQRAQRAGLNCQPLSARYAAGSGPDGLLMGFTNVASLDEARRIARRLQHAFGS